MWMFWWVRVFFADVRAEVQHLLVGQLLKVRQSLIGSRCLDDAILSKPLTELCREDADYDERIQQSESNILRSTCPPPRHPTHLSNQSTSCRDFVNLMSAFFFRYLTGKLWLISN